MTLLKESKNNKSNNLYPFLLSFAVALLAIILFALAFRKLWGGGMLAYGDGLPFPLTARQAFSAFYSAWDPRNPGVVVPQLPVAASFSFFVGVLIKLFMDNAFFAQKIFHFAPMPLAFITMYIFLSRFVSSRWAKFAGAFIYSINLTTMGEFLGGFEGTLYVHAIFPLLLIYLSRFLGEKKRLYNMLVFTVLFVFTYLLSDHIFIILTPVVIFLLTEKILSLKNSKYISKYILTTFILLFTAFILWFLLTLPYTLFYIKSALPFLPGTEASIRAVVLETLTQDVRYTYGQWSLFRIIRLGGDLYAPLFGGPPLWAWFGYVLPLGAILSLLFVRQKKYSRYIVGFLTLAIVTIIFIWLTKYQLTLGLFRQFPFLFRFRNPARPTLVLTLAYSSLIAITIEGLQRKFRSLSENSGRIYPRLAYLVISVVIAISVGIYNWPVFTGDFTLARNRQGNYQIPPAYFEMGRWLKARRNSEGSFRTLWLPWSFEESETKLRWIDPYTFSITSVTGLYFESPLAEYIQFASKALSDNRRLDYFGALLAPANVKYIIVNLASKQKGPVKTASAYMNSYSLGSPKSFINILNKQRDLKLIKSNKYFMVYENQQFIPHLNAFNDVLLVPSGLSSDPLYAILILPKITDIGKQILLFDEQLLSRKAKRLLRGAKGVQKKILAPSETTSLSDDFTATTLDSSKWVRGDFIVLKENTVASLRVESGSPQFLESTSRFNYPRVLEVKAKLNRKLNANIILLLDDNNQIRFNYFGAGALLSTITMSQGKTSATKISKVAELDDNYHFYKIVWEKKQVKFYLDGVLKSVHKTNIPKMDLKIRFDGEPGQVFDIDYVKINPLNNEPKTFLTSRSEVPIKFQTRKISETEYRAKVESKAPLFIVLGEVYDPAWNAYVGGKRLEHFPANYWANGFYLNKSGKNEVKITFDAQKTKNLTIIISGITWVLLIIGIVLSSGKLLRNKNEEQ